MNPLGIKPERFTVATDKEGSLLGFGQLEPKDSCMELRSMVVDTAHRYHAQMLWTGNSREGIFCGFLWKKAELKVDRLHHEVQVLKEVFSIESFIS